MFDVLVYVTGIVKCICSDQFSCLVNAYSNAIQIRNV